MLIPKTVNNHSYLSNVLGVSFDQMGVVTTVKEDYFFAKSFYGDVWISLTDYEGVLPARGDVIQMDIMEYKKGRQRGVEVRLVYQRPQYSSEQKSKIYQILASVDRATENQKKDILEKSLIEFPEDVKLMTMLINVYFNDLEKNAKRIFELIQKGLELAPLDKFLIALAGKYYYKIGNFALAKEYFERGLKLAPNDLVALGNLGKVDYVEKNYERAEEKFNQILKLNPQSEMALNSLGQVAMARKDYRLARKIFDSVLKINPKNIYARFLKGITLIDQRLYEEAILYFETYQKISKTFEGTYYYLQKKIQQTIDDRDAKLISEHLRVLNAAMLNLE